MISVLAVGLSLASGVGQGQWYAYHFVGLPVLAAGVWARAVCLASTRARAVLIVAPLIAGLLSAVLLAQDLGWRREVFGPVVAAFVVLSLCTVFGALAERRWAARRTPGTVLLAAATTALAACLLPAGLPAAAYAFDGFDDQYTNAGLLDSQRNAHAEYDQVRQRIGTQTPVLYLAYGSKAYLLGSPTPCRYPSPVFVSRSTYDSRIRSLGSYADNLSCYEADSAARYLVMDRAWADLDRLEPALRRQLTTMFDCSRSFTSVAGGATLEFCPRV